MAAEADATLRAARIAAWVSGVGAAISAIALLANTVITAQSTESSAEKDRELKLLIYATDRPSSQLAYCNLKFWRDAGMIRREYADKAVSILQNKPGVADDKCS